MQQLSSSLFYPHPSAGKTKYIKTVKELKEHLEDIPDNSEVNIWDGKTRCTVEVSIDSSVGHYKYYNPFILRILKKYEQ